ncbi:aminotransferase class I/II-fold pyridoxal phosphate-dependent enzyme [Alistipes indistinctus]|jgi:aspartate/methionine/tyrosine aminotransferase|uniref:aminotransferase class I/II-fold pyridoxal phosphate-dependent enzyme n=2 Tax=Alistipes indistinctus TaxID=626932 RepID=UPI000E516CBB|nr:pyridoxal phosphate-dependent aminotransferase [Alistipes indistinctus]RGU38519.1 pyridoxal phosphate-dependent aminotransferase [Alistipes indistinctus]BCG54822.1 aminotransferase [Alistipes indistinctus]
MQNRVYSQELVDRVVDELKITDLEQATIGQVVLLASRLEELTGIPFIRMDQGVPGLEPCRIGTEAEKQALDTWIPAIYPAAEGIPELKTEASRFVKAFLDVDISAAACVPVTGSVAGSFGSFIACTQCDPGKNTVLFIDPGFPIQKSQLKVLGIPHVQFDVHDFRGEKLRAKLESYLEKGNIAGIIYSNPNNPAWISLTESELQVLGELATRYGAVVLEDLAYFGMDFRSDFGRPFEPPYIPTAARYTDNYILMLSSSKIFSYAGQRAAMLCISDSLFGRRFPALAERYAGAGIFGPTLIGSILYMITSGITHSTQFGYAAMLRAATEGRFDFVKETSEYARRSRRMKDLFEQHGFHVVYDKDIDRAISDGFFFTIGYGGMPCGELMRELLYYGISSISLSTTGSEQQGIRACCSRMSEDLYGVLDDRLRAFRLDH